LSPPPPATHKSSGSGPRVYLYAKMGNRELTEYMSHGIIKINLKSRHIPKTPWKNVNKCHQEYIFLMNIVFYFIILYQHLTFYRDTEKSRES
jgi:hypothetical protein